MKKTTPFIIITMLSLALLVGCSTTDPQRPPSQSELKFFDVTTNYVPRVTVDPATQQPVTNIEPSYVFKPNALSQQTSETVGSVVGLGIPGWSALATALVSGIFGVWGTRRSRQANASAETLAQIIETGQQVLLTAPNGAELAAQWKAWMIKHQAETGTIADVSKLVANYVDTDEARKVAEQIAALLKGTTAQK